MPGAHQVIGSRLGGRIGRARIVGRRLAEQALLTEKPLAIEVDRTAKPYDDFQKWCREIVWWGNKKGAYLYSPQSAAITPELAGHY